MKNASIAVWLGVLAFWVAGCQSAQPKARPLTLVVSKTTPASIKVDLIGVTEAEKPAWEGYDLDQYWAEGDSRRANADKLTLALPTGQPLTVRKDDPHWQNWIRSGATELLVIADLPGQFPPGPTDPRRIFIPLDKRSLKVKDDTLEIQVQDTLVRPVVP